MVTLLGERGDGLGGGDTGWLQGQGIEDNRDSSRSGNSSSGSAAPHGTDMAAADRGREPVT